MQDFIKTSLEYIEHNLKTDITLEELEELAQTANYSVRHYCRRFSQVTGSSVANYIAKRRVNYALAEISSGRKAIDTILDYGFDTYSGFYRAFVKKRQIFRKVCLFSLSNLSNSLPMKSTLLRRSYKSV